MLSTYLTCERGEEGEEPEDLLGLFLVGRRLEVDFISSLHAGQPLDCQEDIGPEHTQGPQSQPSHLPLHPLQEQKVRIGDLRTLFFPFREEQDSQSDASINRLLCIADLFENPA